MMLLVVLSSQSGLLVDLKISALLLTLVFLQILAMGYFYKNNFLRTGEGEYNRFFCCLENKNFPG